MTVSAQTPYSSQAANGVTTSFPFSYKVRTAADLVVTLTDSSGNEITQTLGVHYTVSGVGAANGGSVTFVSAPANGVTVKTRRATTLSRSTDYQNNGDLLAAVLNGDMDALWLVLQELLSGTQSGSNALVVPTGEVLAKLPGAAARKDRALVFNGATGQPEISQFTTTQLASVIATIYAAAAGPLDALSFIQGGLGAIVRMAQEKIRAIEVSVADFGAVGDGVTDDTAAIQKAINYCIANKKELWFDVGDYLVSSTLLATLPDKGSLTLRGKGQAAARYREPPPVGARLIATGTGWTDGQPMITTNTPPNWHRTTLFLENICFIGDNPDTDGVDTAIIVGYYAHVNSFVRGCGFYRLKYGVRYDGGFSKFIECCFAKCSWIGLYMEKGDAQVTDCQFDNIRRDSDDGRTNKQGSGIYVWKGSNINITGGKIEACQKGIQIYRAQGINITGINFDYCRYTVCGLSELDGEEPYAIRSINIGHCRFLASISKHVVFENNTSYQSTLTFTGCSFARGNSSAFDNNTTGLQPDGTYPANNFLDFRGSGSFDVVFNGNNTLLAATAVSVFFPASGTLNLTANSDAFITVDLGGGDGKVVRPPRFFVMAAVPTTGVWKQGDLIWIQFPGAGKAVAHACVLAGDFAGTPPQFQPIGILGAVKAEPATDIATLLPSLRTAGLLKP